ncbi:MAG: universal stress protein [Gammaproteobacteria bacterium]|jgi:nucleotide-binding universal stress UspA family protein|nr:universal stress protein [Gammaproteobacteria bacterium]
MQRFKNILCVVNTDMQNNVAVEHAVKLAEKNQVGLTVVEVIDKIVPNTTLYERIMSPVDLQAEMISEHQNRLQELISPWEKNIEIKTRVLTGILFLEVIHEVLRNGHDLLFKTADSGVLLNRVFGSDDMHLLRKCPCPVWLVKPESPKTYQMILAAVDVNDDYPSEELNTRHSLNHQILEIASSLALSECANLHIVHAWRAIGEGTMRGAFMARPEEEVASYIEEVKQQHVQNMKELMSETIDKLGQEAQDYIKPKKNLIKGDPRKIIPAFAEEIKADLIVMGTVARTGLSGFFMGNTAETILNQINCSVLAIKPPGFVTPVTLDD